MAPHRGIRIIIRIIAVVIGVVVGVFVINHAGVGFYVQRVHVLLLKLVLRQHVFHITLHASAIGTS